MPTALSLSWIIGIVVSQQWSCWALVYVEKPGRVSSKPAALIQTQASWSWPWSKSDGTIEMEVDKVSRAFPNRIHSVVSRPARSDLVLQLYQGQEPFGLFTNPRKLSFKGDLIWSNIGHHPEDVKYLIDLANASFICEVGSYVGTSTKNWAQGLRQKGVPKDKRVLLAIDTWLGDLASWVTRVDAKSRPVPDDVLVDGRSHLYDQFMLNMIQNNMTDTVVPFSTTSSVAARWLAYQNYEADLMYVDSAHEQGETVLELELYWNQLRKGGVLAGDDYPGWPAVKHDVDDFAARKGLDIRFAPSGTTWYVLKP